ncbi:MAG: hypothetical protein JRJ38_14340 [Deltaproteobacteria bacterium]|nr:hypothetical protein [Deltaproteobacteria bacterium]
MKTLSIFMGIVKYGLGASIAYSNPHHPRPGDDHLEGGIFAVDVAGGFIFVGAAECLILNKAVV